MGQTITILEFILISFASVIGYVFIKSLIETIIDEVKSK